MSPLYFCLTDSSVGNPSPTTTLPSIPSQVDTTISPNPMKDQKIRLEAEKRYLELFFKDLNYRILRASIKGEDRQTFELIKTLPRHAPLEASGIIKVADLGCREDKAFNEMLGKLYNISLFTEIMQNLGFTNINANITIVPDLRDIDLSNKLNKHQLTSRTSGTNATFKLDDNTLLAVITLNPLLLTIPDKSSETPLNIFLDGTLEINSLRNFDRANISNKATANIIGTINNEITEAIRSFVNRRDGNKSSLETKKVVQRFTFFMDATAKRYLERIMSKYEEEHNGERFINLSKEEQIQHLEQNKLSSQQTFEMIRASIDNTGSHQPVAHQELSGWYTLSDGIEYSKTLRSDELMAVSVSNDHQNKEEFIKALVDDYKNYIKIYSRLYPFYDLNDLNVVVEKRLNGTKTRISIGL